MSMPNSITMTERSSAQSIVWQVGSETQALLGLGNQRGWDFTVLGRAPMPEEAIRLGEWLIVPAHLDTSPVPTRTVERIQAIFASGLRPKGFVVVHEAPYLLPAPSQVESEFVSPKSRSDLEPALKVTGSVLGVLGTVAVVASGLAILAIGALSVVTLLAIPAALAAGAIALDPMLIAIIDDDCWIEIDRWWN